jgi:hypothetical protein
MPNDIFANIAAGYNVDNDRGLISPTPSILEDKIIVLNPNDKDKFIPYKKMDTKEELHTELSKLRENYKPFLKDYAPAIEIKEKRINITDFEFSLNGGGIENVTIPHYGGPIGQQTAIYKSSFSLNDFCAKSVIISFKGVDYIAEVFINDEFVGRHEGFFSPFEFDITSVSKIGQNTLKVIVKNDFAMLNKSVGDKVYAATGLGWDDPQLGWHHCPAGMGIYNSVFVEIREKEYITDIFVRNGEEVWIECNGSEIEEKDVCFELSLYGQNFEETLFENLKIVPTTRIEAGVGDTLTEAKLIAEGKLGAGTPLKICKGFNRFILPIYIEDKKIWKPDAPSLYQIQVKLVVNNEMKSIKKRQFGIRTFTQDTKSDKKGMFYLNGEKVKLRGANTMGFEQQCVMKGDFEQLIDDILLAKICNMNFLRLTQRPVQEEIYDYCDRLGMMIQTDLPLFGSIRINQFCETLRQVEEMEKLIRSHPCCIIASYINEPFPNANNVPHRMIKRNDMMNFFTAADMIIKLSNPDRVTKHVDGDYDPPSEAMPDNHCYCMWYNGHGSDMGRLHKGYWLEVKPNWYYGCGEFGAEGLDFVDVMKNDYPKEWLKQPFNPINIIGAQTGNFHYFFYETPKTIEDWVTQSHKHQAFATKIMTNAMRRDNDMVTFAIHLFIDAWPSGWMKTIMDYKRNPKPSYYTYRDSLTPIMANLRTDRFTYFSKEKVKIESYICNDTQNDSDYEVAYNVEYQGKTIFSKKQSANVAACETTFQGFVEFDLPKVEKREKIILSMGILKDEKVIHYTTEEFEIFPVTTQKNLELLEYDVYLENKTAIDNKIKNGEKVVFSPLKQGEYEIADKKIVVTDCGMHPLYFVSRDTGHNAVKDFVGTDFSHWYDSENDMLAPIIYSTFKAEAVTPILTSGNQDNIGNWDKVLACGEFEYGNGKITLCQVELKNKEKNPVAVKFINEILG